MSEWSLEEEDELFVLECTIITAATLVESCDVGLIYSQTNIDTLRLGVWCAKIITPCLTAVMEPLSVIPLHGI